MVSIYSYTIGLVQNIRCPCSSVLLGIMLPVVSMHDTTVETSVVQDLANGFSALYQYDKEQLGYVANFELENLKETCVWLVDFYTDSWSKAELCV